MLRGHYRSRPEIIELASRHFYGPEGAELVHVPRARGWSLGGYALRSKCKGDPVAGPEPPVVAVHVDGSETRDSASASWFNEEEVRAVARIVERLAGCVERGVSLGVIAPYRAQAARLREELESLKNRLYEGGKWPFAEKGRLASTVDSFQGRERDIIIYSVTATTRKRLKFASDRRRLNVAITRARSKLIIVANVKAVRSKGRGLPIAGVLGEIAGKAGVARLHSRRPR